ncbi:MAG: 30S ribosomal protein S6 [Defluviitaleaceae bacterium]|nr:30S ribosomal protein S6 [Defluviitaleaceae bacterium]
MNSYELTVVFKPNLEEEVLKTEQDQIMELLNRFEATIEKVDDWGRRKLAYEIEKINEGIYRFITFTANATVVAEIENRMRIRENLLRYLIIKNEVQK